jgi:hypothetical protein
MPRWEYQVLEFGEDKVDERTRLDELLKEVEAKGWELVVEDKKVGDTTKVQLRRLVEDGSPQVTGLEPPMEKRQGDV